MKEVELNKFYVDPRSVATKIKIFTSHTDTDVLENEINEFIKDKILIDIKYAVDNHISKYDQNYYPDTVTYVDRVIVMYREFPF